MNGHDDECVCAVYIVYIHTHTHTTLLLHIVLPVNELKKRLIFPGTTELGKRRRKCYLSKYNCSLEENQIESTSLPSCFAVPITWKPYKLRDASSNCRKNMCAQTSDITKLE